MLVLAISSFATFRWVLVPIRTEGISMLPTYQSGSLKFANRLAYMSAKPERGDIVAIRLAGPHVVYVKRVIGLPGETVAFVDGQVLINGTPLQEPYVRNRRPWNLDGVTLGPREYFVVGDNRGMRIELHDLGTVRRDRIVGQMLW